MALSYSGSSLPQTTCRHECSNQNSILGSINTGFGLENSLSFNSSSCDSNATTLLHLYKETYLSEFETEEEKAQVRLNLGVPSKEEVQKQVSLQLQEYATKADVDKVVAGTLSLQNYYTKKEVDDQIKNSSLILDAQPIQYSVNGVTSGGVWQYVDNVVGAIHRYTLTI